MIETVNPAQDSRRRFVVNLVFFIYILMLVEGPLRKWFIPGLATPIYFIRDPFVIFLYAYCLQRRLMLTSDWAKTWMIFAAFASAIGAFPFLIQGIDPRAWFLGVRTYWLYMPLAFVVGSTFEKNDFLRFIRLNVLLSIPYAALVIAQYNSSPTAWINGGIGGDEGVVLVAYNIIRPSGLFTYTGQNVNFSACLIALFMSFLLLKSRGRKSSIILVAAAPAVASLAVLSGSRSIYFMVAASLLAAMTGTAMAKPTVSGAKTNVLLLGCVALAALLFVHVFADAYQAMQARMQHAERVEGGMHNRIMFGFLEVFWQISKVPALGHGIGLGAPAITRFLDHPNFGLGESEITRNVNELGLVNGFIFFALRFAFAYYLIRTSVKAARAGQPEFLPLAGLAGLAISQGPITVSSLSGFPFWLLSGLVLASRRIVASEAPHLRQQRAAAALQNRS